MKRSKRIYLLAGVLAVALIATFGVMQFEEYKEQIKNSDETILAIDEDEVTSLAWENESESLSFHKDETWIYDEDENFPVDEEKIGELLGQFADFGVSFVIENVEDYGQYGLDDPVCTINISTEDTDYEISLGNYSNMDSERYVSIGDGNVYLVQNDPLDYFDAVLDDMLKDDEVPSFDSVTGIRFSGAETYSISYEEDSDNTYCADDVYFTEQDGKTVPLDTDRVDSYLDTLRYLSLDNDVTYNATDEELTEYGLDDPELTISVDYTSENEDGEEESGTFVLHLSRSSEERDAEAESEQEEETESEESEEDETITAYARVGESQIVYQIYADDYRELMKASYDSLRHEEVLTADFSDITQIDISLEGNDYTFTSDGNEDERTWYYQEKELEIDDLQLALSGLAADSFTSEDPKDQEEISLTVHLDNENYPEVTIGLYRYDGENCLAVVDGEPVSLVPRSQVSDLKEAVYAIVLNET